jgi:hypothetical protein
MGGDLRYVAAAALQKEGVRERKFGAMKRMVKWRCTCKKPFTNARNMSILSLMRPSCERLSELKCSLKFHVTSASSSSQHGTAVLKNIRGLPFRQRESGGYLHKSPKSYLQVMLQKHIEGRA